MTEKSALAGRCARGFAHAAVSWLALGIIATGMAGAGQVAPAAVETASQQPPPAPDASAVPQAAPVAAAAQQPAASPAPTAAAAPAAPAAAEPEDHAGTPGLKPAKELFGAAKDPAPLSARAIGTYARGCLSGAKALPVDGPAWQAMRLSRNRNWGHPKLIALVQKLAADGRDKDGWPGLLVGDLSQPRGGPMLTGHASHQIGLDADVWLTPMPDRRLTEDERETLAATSLLADDAASVAREKWSAAHLNILKRAASYPEVERVLVHPAIKQVLCYAAEGDRGWLHKIRPYWGHHYHFHIRIACPPNSASCEPQAATPGDDGCGKELDDWLKRVANAETQPALPLPPAKAPKEKPPITLDKLPTECRVVLATGNPDVTADVAAASLAAGKAKDKQDHKHALAKAGEHKAGEPKPAVSAPHTAGLPAAVASGTPAAAPSKPAPSATAPASKEAQNRAAAP